MELGGIYEEYAQMIYCLIYSKCKDEALAEDIVQTTFLKVVQQSDSFRGECKLSTWLCQIAKNEYLNYCRKHRRIQSYDVYIEQGGDVGKNKGYIGDVLLERIIEKEQAKDVVRALKGLGEVAKEVFMLRVFGECSFGEIGEVFTRDATWARVTYYRAKTKIVKELERKERQNEL